jgi:hypothetical protein
VCLAVLTAINLQPASPPFGFAVFFLHNIASKSISTSDIYWGVAPFIFVQLIAGPRLAPAEHCHPYPSSGTAPSAPHHRKKSRAAARLRRDFVPATIPGNRPWAWRLIVYDHRKSVGPRVKGSDRARSKRERFDGST